MTCPRPPRCHPERSGGGKAGAAQSSRVRETAERAEVGRQRPGGSFTRSTFHGPPGSFDSVPSRSQAPAWKRTCLRSSASSAWRGWELSSTVGGSLSQALLRAGARAPVLGEGVLGDSRGSARPARRSAWLRCFPSCRSSRFGTNLSPKLRFVGLVRLRPFDPKPARGSRASKTSA